MIIYKKFIFIISIFASYKTEIICEKKKYMTYTGCPIEKYKNAKD